jgi:hypothetical protein
MHPALLFLLQVSRKSMEFPSFYPRTDLRSLELFNIRVRKAGKTTKQKDGRYFLQEIIEDAACRYLT